MNIPFAMKTRPVLVVLGGKHFTKLWENYSKSLDDLLGNNFGKGVYELSDIQKGVEAIYLAKKIAEQMRIEHKIKTNHKDVQDVDKYLQNIEKHIEKSFVRGYREYEKRSISFCRYYKSYYQVNFYVKRKKNIYFTEFARLVVEITPVEIF